MSRTLRYSIIIPAVLALSINLEAGVLPFVELYHASGYTVHPESFSIRLKDATDHLHQTEMMETVAWTIIDIPGYTSVPCPALMCYPYVIMPSANNSRNLRNFISLAGEYEPEGVCKTIRVPRRYLSDVMWTRIAYAAWMNWSGSIWDDAAFHGIFFRNYFGSGEGKAFYRVWQDPLYKFRKMQEFHSRIPAEGPDHKTDQ